MGERGRPTGRTQPEGELRRIAGDFRALSHDLLHSASLGVPRVDFIREASRMILDFSGCDLIELLLQEEKARYRCRTAGPPDWRFTYEILQDLPGGDAASGRSPEQTSDLDRLAERVLAGTLRPSPPFVTRSGSFWTGDTRVPFSYREEEGDSASARAYRLGGGYLSVARPR